MDVLLELVPGGEASAEEGERLAVRLRTELGGLGLKAQALAGGPPPERAKGHAATAAAVVLALSVPGGVLTSLVGLVQDWLGRQAAGTRVVINGNEVDGRLTPEQTQQLIDALVREHGTGGQ